MMRKVGVAAISRSVANFRLFAHRSFVVSNTQGLKGEQITGRSLLWQRREKQTAENGRSGLKDDCVRKLSLEEASFKMHSPSKGQLVYYFGAV